VAHLERSGKNMNPAQVATSYDSLAARWTDAGFNRTNGIAPHLRALQFVQRRQKALDVGCGSSGRFIDVLIGQGFAVEGLDFSSEMLRLARLRHPHLVFHHADICTWTAPRTYDFITAWDSIWHVPLSSQREVLKKLCSALSPHGVIIFTAGGPDEAGEKHDHQMGVPMYHATIGVGEIVRTLDESGCTCRHLEYDQHPELHVYLIAQKT
jgi:2-polyprenyl-3-methyl-5-hydroxy-6-metoxy-1,4-benzoquinol methylase